MSGRKLPKEHRGRFAELPRRSYSEKLKDPRWQKKRLEVFNAAGWRCQECRAEDQSLNVHHTLYPTGCEGPWDVPSELLLCLCETHHRERQEVEQRILVGVARRLCALNLRGLRAVDCTNGGPAVATIMRGASLETDNVPPAETSNRAPRQMHFAANGQWL